MNRRLVNVTAIILSSLCLSFRTTVIDAKTATKSSSSQDQTNPKPAGGGGGSTATRTLPRRERNLDFFDAATLAYYLGLDPETGGKLDDPSPSSSTTTHNVAVMFYAQWDRNSHALAPIWDAIGTRLGAGTKKANLILGLFDCELNQQHLILCTAAGVTHYPTLMFLSPSRTFPHKPHWKKTRTTASAGRVLQPHATIFPGIWQYEKSVLDWVKTMQMLAGWSAFWDNKQKKKKGRGWWQAASYDPATADALPVGIPTTTTAMTSSSSSSSSAGGSANANDLKTIQELKAEKQQYEELVLRSSILLDATLFPITDPTTTADNSHNNNSTDLFAHLHRRESWDATDVQSQVLRTCAMEIALDYCTRVTTHKTDELVSLKRGTDTTQLTLAELEKELSAMIASAEPYCHSIDACLLGGFSSPTCRPARCPFRQDVACRYLSACFEESLQQDYAKAMGLELPTKTASATGGGASKTTTTTSSSSAKSNQPTATGSTTTTSSSGSSTSTTATTQTQTATTDEAPKKKRGWF